MNRSRTRTHLGLTTGTLATALALATVATPGHAHRANVFHGPLQDLQPATAEPFDAASALVIMAPARGSTLFVLKVRGADPAASGQSFGAHLHVGPCIAGDGAAAGAHYNVSTATPPVVNDQTEVWLDVTVGPAGRALSVTRVPFQPVPGTRSVVIHALPTDPAGVAGPRLACLPVEWE